MRLVSKAGQNQLAGVSPDHPSKSPTEIPTPPHDSRTSPSGFNRESPEIRSLPKVKKYTLLRRTPIPSFLPIQTPPDSPIFVEPQESSSGNFVFHLHTPETSTTHRRISHPYAQPRVDPSASCISDFPRSPSQEFHTCDEQSPGHPSPASSSTSPIHRLLGRVASNVKSLSPSLFVNVGGSSPSLAPTQDLTTQRRGGVNYTEDSLDGQSPPFFGSTSAMTGAKLVPFSASARASVISENPSYTSEYAYQGAMSPALPREPHEYHDYVRQEAVLSTSSKTDSPTHDNDRGQASGSSSEVVSYVGGGSSECPGTGLGRKSSFCVPGALFPIPEEDSQIDSSGSRSRSDPSLSVNESVRVSAASSLPWISSSSYGEFVVSLASASGSSRALNQSTPVASGTGRLTHTAAGSPRNMVQTTHLGSGISSTSPPNASTFRRVGARESYPGSGDLNDGAEMSGACMNDLYEELEEWGCEWIRQDQNRQSGQSAGGV